MKEIAAKRRRFGFRRISVLLERKGMSMTHKKLYRIYREEGLSKKSRYISHNRGVSSVAMWSRYRRGFT
ncbi:IS3 family transposase [Rhodovulum sulfidophilum]|nr:IS3 family transposase [Rhodovulum sulfidophilum]